MYVYVHRFLIYMLMYDSLTISNRFHISLLHILIYFIHGTLHFEVEN